jgi:hypothetical protein
MNSSEQNGQSSAYVEPLNPPGDFSNTEPTAMMGLEGPDLDTLDDVQHQPDQGTQDEQHYLDTPDEMQSVSAKPLTKREQRIDAAMKKQKSVDRHNERHTSKKHRSSHPAFAGQGRDDDRDPEARGSNDPVPLPIVLEVCANTMAKMLKQPEIVYFEDYFANPPFCVQTCILFCHKSTGHAYSTGVNEHLMVLCNHHNPDDGCVLYPVAKTPLQVDPNLFNLQIGTGQWMLHSVFADGRTQASSIGGGVLASIRNAAEMGYLPTVKEPVAAVTVARTSRDCLVIRRRKNSSNQDYDNVVMIDSESDDEVEYSLSERHQHRFWKSDFAVEDIDPPPAPVVPRERRTTAQVVPRKRRTTAIHFAVFRADLIAEQIEGYRGKICTRDSGGYGCYNKRCEHQHPPGRDQPAAAKFHEQEKKMQERNMPVSEQKCSSKEHCNRPGCPKIHPTVWNRDVARANKKWLAEKKQIAASHAKGVAIRADQARVKTASADQAPVKKATGKEAPTVQAPGKKAPTVQAPAAQASTAQASTAQAPTADRASTDHDLAAQASTDQASTDQDPAAQAHDKKPLKKPPKKPPDKK